MKKSITILMVATMFATIGKSQCLPNITTGLIANYPFTGNANDIAGTNNGTVNGATLCTDRFGNANSAYHFSSANNITLSTIEFNNYISSGFTISYWFTMEDSTLGGSSGTHFMLTNYDGVNGVQIAYYSTSGGGNNTFRHSIRTAAASSPEIDYNSSINSNYNIWRHAVYVWSAPNLLSYINGVLVNSQSNTGINNLSVCCSITTMIGSQWNNTSNHLGKLDDIRIYNRVLNACDVDSLYNIPNPQSTTSINSISKKDINIFAYNNLIKVDNVLPNSTIKIFNSLGQIVFESILTNELQTNLSTGIYTIQVLNNNEIIEIKKCALVNNQ